MRVVDAKHDVLRLMKKDIENKNINVMIDENTPDTDLGKFILENKIARVVSPFNGYMPNISLEWFNNSLEMPKINRTEFYWYVFPIIFGGSGKISHYFICDYLRLRKWVLDFDAPTGNDHRDHHDWRCAIDMDSSSETYMAYFRWGDEPIGEDKESRHIKLNNIEEIIEGNFFVKLPDEISDPSIYNEGSMKTVSVNIYERDSKARKVCVDNYGYDCCVCGINFEEIYGELGEGFIHVHHLKPLSDVGGTYVVDPIKDLRPVCPNCHAMIHKKTPPISIDRMKEYLR